MRLCPALWQNDHFALLSSDMSVNIPATVFLYFGFWAELNLLMDFALLLKGLYYIRTPCESLGLSAVGQSLRRRGHYLIYCFLSYLPV